MSERLKNVPVRIEAAEIDSNHMSEISRVAGWKFNNEDADGKKRDNFHFQCPWSESAWAPELYIGLRGHSFAGVWSHNPYFTYALERREDLNYLEFDEENGYVRFVDGLNRRLVVARRFIYFQSDEAQILIHPAESSTNPSETSGPFK